MMMGPAEQGSTRRESILTALREAAGSGVSGERLARELGVSRTAIAKHVAALRAAGYAIDAVPGSGYRLLSSADALTPAEVKPLVESSLWRCFEGGDVTHSTNDDCIALARGGAPEGTVVMAREQRGGKGRLGRSWDSPEGGVYMSMLLRPEMSVLELVPLPMVVSIGVARACERLGLTGVGLKWPNDVWYEGRKLAGVLLESAVEGESVRWVVAGVGLNVAHSDERAHSASYMRDRLPAVRIAEAAAAVLDGVAEVYAQFVAMGFAGLAEEYERRSVLKGSHVTVSAADGSLLGEGSVEGIDALGRLLVTSEGGTIAIAAGDVTLRRPPASWSHR